MFCGMTICLQGQYLCELQAFQQALFNYKAHVIMLKCIITYLAMPKQGGVYEPTNRAIEKIRTGVYDIMQHERLKIQQVEQEGMFI